MEKQLHTTRLIAAVLLRRKKMTPFVRRSLGVAVVVLVCATPAVADPVILVTTRSVSVAFRTPDGGGVFNHRENADVLDLSAYLGAVPFVTARLRSDASNAAHIVASGTAKAASPTDRHTGIANVEYRFLAGIETAQPFDVLLEATGISEPLLQRTGISFFIREASGDGDLFDRLTIAGSGRMTLHGILLPVLPDEKGRTWYPFVLLGSAYADPGSAPSSVRFNVSVSFPSDSAPVPEPGTMLLTAASLGVVLKRGRARTNKRRLLEQA